MIGSYILGTLVFSIFDSMYSITPDVLIKILKGLSSSDPNMFDPQALYVVLVNNSINPITSY